MKNRFIALLPLSLFFFFFAFPAFGQNTDIKIVGPTSVCHGCYYYKVEKTGGGTANPPALYVWTVIGPNNYAATYTDTVPYICFPVAGTYQIRLELGTINGTVQVATLTVVVAAYVPVEIVSNNPAACANADSTLDPDNNYCEKVCPYSTATYSYSPASGNPGTNSQISWQVTGAQSFTVNPPFNSSVTVHWGSSGAGSVSVVVVGIGSSSQCIGEDALCVTIIEEPRAQFDTDPPTPTPADTLTVCKGQTVYFDNLSQHADSYEWLFSDDGSALPDIHPQHTFSKPGLHSVRLVARSACLCADTATALVRVLDAEAPTLDCVGDVCPGATVRYRASANCSGINWAVSPNGIVLNGGSPGADSITVEWGAGPIGAITLSNFSCTGLACPQPTVVRVPIIDNNAEIRGAERVCPDAEEVYYIEPFGGTGFVWTLSGGGAL
ncbi:MAG: PKD domain-containing protein, partial [Saprospiraceae bacterium]|nr:PKD domain-containing protein [Saprospiraceae bacterium]